MNRMPPALRAQLSEDPEYKVCARRNGGGCSGRTTFEHAILYANRQVQERWAILPLCQYHHLWEGLDKAWNVRYAMSRATDDDRRRYPRLRWSLVP